jgi:hypothetical protein
MRRHGVAADELARAYRAGFDAGLREATRLTRQHAEADYTNAHLHKPSCLAMLAKEIEAAILAQSGAPLTRP